MPNRTSPNRDTPVVDLHRTPPMLRCPDGQEIALDTTAWRTWLAATPRGFYVLHPDGNFSCRRDGRAAGGQYWTATRRHHGRAERVYLGKDETLTGARLSEVGDELAEAVVEAAAARLLPVDQPPDRRDPSRIVIAAVRTEAERLWIDLDDGRTIGVPLSWFPRLAAAPDAARQCWERLPNGSGIHWSALDEEISARVLLGLPA